MSKSLKLVFINLTYLVFLRFWQPSVRFYLQDRCISRLNQFFHNQFNPQFLFLWIVYLSSFKITLLNEVDLRIKRVINSFENDDWTTISTHETIFPKKDQRPNKIPSKLSHEKDNDSVLLNKHKLRGYKRSYRSFFRWLVGILEIYPSDTFIFSIKPHLNRFLADFSTFGLSALNVMIGQSLFENIWFSGLAFLKFGKSWGVGLKNNNFRQ